MAISSSGTIDLYFAACEMTFGYFRHRIPRLEVFLPENLSERSKSRIRKNMKKASETRRIFNSRSTSNTLHSLFWLFCDFERIVIITRLGLPEIIASRRRKTRRKTEYRRDFHPKFRPRSDFRFSQAAFFSTAQKHETTR